jgi:hypothetical protein
MKKDADENSTGLDKAHLVQRLKKLVESRALEENFMNNNLSLNKA